MAKTKTLLLFPTYFEQQKVSKQIERLQNLYGLSVGVCGFGVIESGLGARAELSGKVNKSPDKVILCGVAGSLNPRLIQGKAYQFQRVGCYGIGIGNGEHFQSAFELGWLQGDPFYRLQVSELNSIDQEVQDLLLTVCAGSANAEEAKMKLVKFPQAMAEEMEGYSVAVACAKLGLPLHIVRGISNCAGNRTHANWLVDEAMQSAMQIVERLVSA
jgi:futalosine hydrolase